MTRQRFTVSVPDDVADDIRRAVATGTAKDASAYVTNAVRRFRRRLTPDETLAAIREDLGELPADAIEWAKHVHRPAARHTA